MKIIDRKFLQELQVGQLINFDGHVKGFAIDSREIKEDMSFVALKGQNTDGHNYLDQAYENGASLMIVSQDWWNKNQTENWPLLVTEEPEKALQKIATKFHNTIADFTLLMCVKIKDRFGIDIVVLSGGVSAGEYDYIPEIVEKLGFEIIWHKIAMKPGKPQLFAKKENKMIFGLPGNPVSTTLSLYIFVLPIIKKLTGFKKIWEDTYFAPLKGRTKRKARRYHFVPAKVKEVNGEYKLKTVITNGSGDIKGASKADAYMIIPPETEDFNKDKVEFFFLK